VGLVVSSFFVLEAGRPEVLGEGMFTPLARMQFTYLLSACLRPRSPVGRACAPADGAGRLGGVVDVCVGAVRVLPGFAAALPGVVAVLPGVVAVRPRVVAVALPGVVAVRVDVTPAV
jgi:hypothetical protein